MSRIWRKIPAHLRDIAVGMNSAFDLFPKPVRKTHHWYWDWLELRRDFEITGQDMWRAIGQIDPNGQHRDPTERRARQGGPRRKRR